MDKNFPLATKEARIISRPFFEEIYNKYTVRELVSPDPLQFLYNYTSQKDIEAVALIASSLAYGRVGQILKAVGYILNILGESPAEYLQNVSTDELRHKLNGFVYRFNDEKDVCYFLLAIGNFLRQGTLEELFVSGFNGDIVQGANNFVSNFVSYMGHKTTLLPLPSRGSACKRLFLFLRWMVRRDNVDLGLWAKSIPASSLIIPLDTHAWSIASNLGLCTRRSACLLAAKEITESYRDICEADPVKYDFAVTRFGIRNEFQKADLIDSLTNWLEGKANDKKFYK